MEPYPLRRPSGRGRDLHARPPRVLAEPADRQRRARLRRRRPLPLRDDRLRARAGRDRRPGRDDVPPHCTRPAACTTTSGRHGRAAERTKETQRMASNGIKDRVAIVGMGCTKFGEHWDKGPRRPARSTPRTTRTRRRASIRTTSTPTGSARWAQLSGSTLSVPLKIPYKPVTHVENFCATGSEALRQACYAVAIAAPTTSRWRSASRSSRTRATRASSAPSRRTTARSAA